MEILSNNGRGKLISGRFGLNVIQCLRYEKNVSIPFGSDGRSWYWVHIESTKYMVIN